MKKILIFIFLQVSFLYAEQSILIPFKLNGKIGFINKNLEIEIKPLFDTVEEFIDNSFIVSEKSKKYFLNEYIIKGVYEPVLLGKGYYAIYNQPDTIIYDAKGNVITRLNNIQIEQKSTFGHFIVYKNNSEDIMTLNGEYIFEDPNIKQIYAYDSLSKTAIGRYLNHGDCLISINGIKSVNGFKFGMRSYNEGLVFGKNRELEITGFFDMNSKLIIKADVLPNTDADDWNCFSGIHEGVVPLIEEKNSSIYLSEYQLFYSKNYKLVDNKGRVIKSGIEANHIYSFNDNVAVLLLIENNEEKYNLIDKNGNAICDCFYDKIENSINGYCMAQKNGIDYLICSSDGKKSRCSEFK